MTELQEVDPVTENIPTKHMRRLNDFTSELSELSTELYKPDLGKRCSRYVSRLI